MTALARTPRSDRRGRAGRGSAGNGSAGNGSARNGAAGNGSAGRDGFTLLEVLIAFAILAITLTALYQAYSANLLIHNQTRGLWKAMVYVSNDLKHSERNPPQGVDLDQGEFPADDPMAGYAWRREVSLESPLPGVTIRKITLRVSWKEGSNERWFQAETYVPE